MCLVHLAPFFAVRVLFLGEIHSGIVHLSLMLHHYNQFASASESLWVYQNLTTARGIALEPIVELPHVHYANDFKSTGLRNQVRNQFFFFLWRI